MLTRDECPTLRLVTLRRLVRKQAPIVFESSVTIATIEATLRASPSRVAVLVSGRVLVGTLCLADLRVFDRSQGAETAMVTDAPAVGSEHDIEAARLAMFTHDSDRVLVVDAAGQLLGVLTAADLEAAAHRAA